MVVSQILSVLSKLPLSTLAPSGEKVHAHTSPECPLRVRFSTPAKEARREQQARRECSGCAFLHLPTGTA